MFQQICLHLYDISRRVALVLHLLLSLKIICHPTTCQWLTEDNNYHYLSSALCSCYVNSKINYYQVITERCLGVILYFSRILQCATYNITRSILKTIFLYFIAKSFNVYVIVRQICRYHLFLCKNSFSGGLKMLSIVSVYSLWHVWPFRRDIWCNFWFPLTNNWE